MHRDEQIIYGLLCLAAMGFYFIVIPWQIEEPDWVAVSPAFLPRVCTVLVFVLALYKLLSTLSLANGEYMVSRLNYVYLFGVLVMLAVATLAMYWVGFWASMAVALVALQLIGGQRKPLVLAGYAAALTGISWFLLDLADLHIVAPY